jgi:PAS domain S-box-containing protein
MSQAHSSVIGDEGRLDALRRLELLDSSAEPAFDRLTRLAARILKAPVTLISFVDDRRQLFKGAFGLSGPWATLRETPLSHSFCQYVVASGTPLIIDDARTHPLVRNNLAIRDLNAIAYAGIPLITHEGYTLGSFCAIDSTPRVWTDDEVAILSDLAAAVMTEIELRAEIVERKQAEETTHHLAEQRKRLLEVAQAVVSTLALDEILPKLRRTLQEVLEHDALSVYWVDEEAGVLRPAHTISPIWLSDQVSTWAIPLGSGIAGSVGRSGRAELVNHAHLDPRSIYPPGTTSAQPHHMICVPIRTNDSIRGVLIMSRNDGAAFTEQEFQLVQLFVSFVALAIENARLFQQTRESQERFAKIFRASPVAYTITSLATGRFLEVNQAFVDLMGYSRDEVIGRTTIELDAWADPADRERVVQLLQQQQSVRSLELTFRTKSGAMLETLASMEIIELSGERCILSLTQDITSYKRTEEALRESEERFRRLSEVSFEGIAIHDHGLILDANAALATLLGYEPGEVIGMNVMQFAAPESREIILRNIREGSQEPYEVVGMWKDGTTLPLEIQARPFTYQGRNVRVAAIRDITERKRAAEALAHERDLLHTLMDNIPDTIYFKDTASRFTRINQAQGRVLNLEDPSEAIGKTDLDFQAPALAAQFLAEEQAIFEAGQPLIDRIEFNPTPDGQPRWFSATKVPIVGRDGRPTGLVGISRDVTERMLAERDRERLIAELTDALTNVKTLRGLLPICSSCKKIRDDHGYWNQIESYIKTHSEADFTHGICPDCVVRLYGDLYNE